MSDQLPLRPASADELRDTIADAARTGRAIEARAGGSKRDIGRPGRETACLDLGRLTGVIDYEPSELVITARPSTPLAEVEDLLASRGQMLAFEPWDHGPLLGRAAGKATIGGVVAAAVAGPRRVSAGGARDHLLGFEAVSGRGEIFRGGGKVVKNVTGYDVSKVIAGSWGQLAIMTELTLKVVPAPRTVATVALFGLDAAGAIQAMGQAMGSPSAVAAAGHLPARSGAPAQTLLRVEGFRESVDARVEELCRVLAPFGPARTLSGKNQQDAWNALTQASSLAGDGLWRVHLAPSRAAAFLADVEQAGADWCLDWAGAAAWIAAPTTCDVRAAAQRQDGHAMLVRGPSDLRERVPARQAEPYGVTVLTARLMQAFDPAGILDPHRFF